MVGFGSPEGQPIPVYSSRGSLTGYKRDANGEMVLSRLDEDTLRRVASATGGQYYNVSRDRNAIAEIVANLTRLEQGELEMTADRLEAFYPLSGSEPERLVATGRVRFQRGDQEARCDRAVYDRLNEMLTCSGNAQFEEKGNRLTGEVIEIDLADEIVKVTGAASIWIEPEKLKEMRRGGKES